jgi:RimJ/RimL family protein N-acetyltransferase
MSQVPKTLEIARDERALGFRRLAMEDLPLMHRWLTTEHVRRWYGEEGRSLEEVTAHYAPRIRGEDPTDSYIILYGETAIGYIQTYLIHDHPDYAKSVDVEERAAGVDLFIGEPDYVHKGLGSILLRKFLREIVFAKPETESCILGPQPKNAVAIRAYEKAGFRYLKTIQVPDEPKPEYLMRITRAESMSQSW